ncbi:MAG: hypothetical protein H6659_17030 [Ardenticatenaceae bacterium]|nr:hypothetical protein [Ardenticatenaceae bacterium]MCB8988718.1 hypothetical protein [Ardenticatenaceae bacterium]
MQKVKRIIYTVMPLTLLLLCLGLINLLPDQQAPAAGSGGQTDKGETAVTTADNTPSALATLAPPTAAPTITPTPAPTPLPTLPPDAAITLLGPPDGSVFSAAAPLSLYWTWPYPLREDEYFAIYLAAAGTEQFLGRVPEPNLGDGYFWQVPPAALSGLGPELSWQIRLQSTLADAPLLASETRAVRLIGGQ